MKALILATIIIFLLVSLRLVFYFYNIQEVVPGQRFEKTVTLLENTTQSFGYQVFTVGNIRIEAASYPELKYGDRLYVNGLVQKRTFLSSSKKEVDQIYIQNPEIKVLAQNNPFIYLAALLRNRVYAQFIKTLPYNEAVLLFGIVFGGSEGFSSQMRDAFRNTGVLHVVAASGMNVTMVGAFFMGFFSMLFKRKTALLLSIAGIFYYALISGLEPSILRASLMISITLLGSILGRQNYGLISLLITAAIMILFSPSIVFSVGFLLSFTSTLGILLIKPIFDSLRLLSGFKAVLDDIATSISAQLGSLPVVLGAFSAYSFISIFVNALVLWTIPFLMILGGIAALCSITLPFVSFIPLYIALPFLWFFEKVVVFFGGIPLVSFDFISPIFFVGYYLILFGLLLMYKKRKHYED